MSFQISEVMVVEGKSDKKPDCGKCQTFIVLLTPTDGPVQYLTKPKECVVNDFGDSKVASVT